LNIVQFTVGGDFKSFDISSDHDLRAFEFLSRAHFTGDLWWWSFHDFDLYY